MGSRFGIRLIAIGLGATALAVAPGIRPRLMQAAEPTARLVPIDAGRTAPLPRLVPIVSTPPAAAVTAPQRMPQSTPGSGSPPLVAISYSPAPAAVKSLAIREIPIQEIPISETRRSAATPAVSLPPMPVAPPAPTYERVPVAIAQPQAPVALPMYQSAALPPPLPVASPPASVSLPPPLPVYVPPVASSPTALPVPLPAPIPVPAASTALAPAPVPTLPQTIALPPSLSPPQSLPQPLQPSIVPQPSSISSQAAVRPPPQPELTASPSAPPASAAAGGKPTDAITIASFNIQVFGESKIAKHDVVDVLTRVVRNFDIVAVQEVRAKSDSVIPQFLSAINADGSRYQFVIGPRLGRTVSKEQYTFIYDSTRIEIDPSSVGTSPNPGDRLHRPPLHARFRVRANPPEAGFSFWLVDTHTDPDEVSAEVNALADVFMEMKALRPDEDDVILLGDLNAGPPQFGKIRQIPGVGWAVSGVTTNTRRSKTYDNIIFDQRATTEYTGRWGVLDLQNTFGLTLDKALAVSDHNPVWAAFRPWEARQVAAAPASGLAQ